MEEIKTLKKQIEDAWKFLGEMTAVSEYATKGLTQMNFPAINTEISIRIKTIYDTVELLEKKIAETETASGEQE